MPTLASLDLPPPRNWQDFEDLCCDLWSRLWHDSETQKNGRSGQSQAGVDVFGRPGRGTEWAGLQCKLRHGGLSRKDLEQEVERARTFKPTLGRFLIATTAPSDIGIQETAREITTAQMERGAFSVSVAAWDYIILQLASYPDLLAKHYPGVFADRGRDIASAAVAQKPPTPIGYRCLAPRPPAYISRGEYQPILRHLLGAAAETGRVVAITTALEGAGGFGKTTLAQALCLDEQVHAAYPDGILWVTFGDDLTDSDRLSRLRDLIRRWRGTEPPAFETIDAAGGYLCGTLAGLRALLVADDVWSPADLLAFRHLEPTSTLFLTTRDRRNLPIGCLTVNVDAMDPEEAVQFLGADLTGLASHRLRQLAERLGEWPLLLGLVHRQLWERIEKEGLPPEQALSDIEALLAEEGLMVFDRDDVEARQLAVGRALNASLRRLPDDERQRYEQLAIFQEDADLPFATLERLWDLPSRHTEAFCRRLHQLSLVVRFEAGPRTIRLHDVVRQYLRDRRKGDLSAIHRRFLEACRPEGGWATLAAEDPYLWRGLTYHLIESDSREELRALLLDYTWIKAKLTATDIDALLHDFETPIADQEVGLVRRALLLSAHALAERPEELSSQLHGRLLNRSEAGIIGLIKAARSESLSKSWLRPRTASLTSPDGPLTQILSGHKVEVCAMAVLPNGRLVSASNDCTMRIWDLASGQTLSTLAGHCAAVTMVAVLSADRIVSASKDYTLRVWDLASGEIVKTLEQPGDRASLERAAAILGLGPSSHGGYNTVAVLANDRIVAASGDHNVQVWDLASGKTLKTLEGHSDRINSVAVLGDGRVVSGSSDGTLRVWNLELDQALRTLEGHSEPVTAIAVLTDGRRIVSASSDRTLRVWDVDSGRVLRILEGHTAGVTAVAAFPDDRIVSASDDCTLRVWDFTSGQLLYVLEGHATAVTSVTVLPDDRIVSASHDGSMRVWDLSSGQNPKILEPQSGWVFALAALPDGHVVSGSDDGLRVWAPLVGRPSFTLGGHGCDVSAVAALPDGRVISGSRAGTLHLWDLNPPRILNTLDGHTDWVRGIAVLHDGRVVSASHDGTLRVWNLSSLETLEILRGHGNKVVSVAILPDDRVVSGSLDGTVRVWNLNSSEGLRILDVQDVYTVAALPDGRVVSGSRDGTLRIWNPDSGECLLALEGHASTVTAMASLPNGRLVSASWDHTVRIWDLGSRKALACLTLDVGALSLAVCGAVMFVAGDSAGHLHFLHFEEGK
jgi:WD40 repeat protein